MYGSPACNAGSRFPRLTLWILVSVFLLVALALAAPEQMPVIAYKVALVTLGVVLAYWLDRALFPYARPHSCLQNRNAPGGGWTDDAEAYRYTAAFAAACLRRALIVLACVLGLTLGL
ncbi:MAG TPA: hypothetical protein DEP32_05565 [Pseudomonas sp.]|nr:hypothetical protein [Pseudomonas sp.]MBB51965.1 hypothetical protein [Pseudomonadales bacterium]HCA23619.1 hypothetical protein [Pseudomonas sp.]|tara:strand:- start:11383 stop:11736 length:354 start_codon:yes stop_codon:yes gene_type:complete